MKVIESGIRDIKQGENVKVIMPVNIYECELGDDVFVGPFVEIQKGCVIGDRTRVQSHTFICENVTLGKDCFIGHGVTFANDLFKNGGPDASAESWIHIVLGNAVTVGSGATILTTDICSGSVIGVGSLYQRFSANRAARHCCCGALSGCSSPSDKAPRSFPPPPAAKVQLML